MPEPANTWYQAPEVYQFGFLYFLTLGLLEWAGFYQARWVDKLAAGFGKPAD